MRRATEEFLQSPIANPSGPGIIARAEALSRDRKQLAQTLRLSSGFLYRIDKGFVALETLPRRLRKDLLGFLRWPVAASSRVLVSVEGAMPAHFLAKSKPQPNEPQSFLDALKVGHSISSEDREWWIAVMDEESLGLNVVDWDSHQEPGFGGASPEENSDDANEYVINCFYDEAIRNITGPKESYHQSGVTLSDFHAMLEDATRKWFGAEKRSMSEACTWDPGEWGKSGD